MSTTSIQGGLESKIITLETAVSRYENNKNGSDNTISRDESGLTEEEYAKLDKHNTGSVPMRDYMNYLAESEEISGSDQEPLDLSSTSGGIKNNTNFV